MGKEEYSFWNYVNSFGESLGSRKKKTEVRRDINRKF